MTSKGVLPLNEETNATTKITSEATRSSQVGLGVSDDHWITWQNRQLFWLPKEFRDAKVALCDNRVVIASSSGRVIVLGFHTSIL
jgi:hypothetical protein